MATARTAATLRTTRGGGIVTASEPLLGLAYIGCADRAAEDAARLVWLGDADEVVIGRGEAVDARGAAGRLEIFAPDQRMSTRHARLVRDGDGYALVDEGSTNGSFVNGARTGRCRLGAGDIVETGHSFWRFVVFVPAEGASLGEASAGIGPTRTICPSFVEQIRFVERIARGKLSVLILGETGTGKEVVARHVHAKSGRKGELRAINCAAIPASLLETELFGHRRGAFTGATEDRSGLVEAAERGTLLLDEVGDLPAEAQAKLLRVLQDGEIVRVGDTRPRKVDVRVVAATNRDLPQLVRAGRFREDLYARLAGFTLTLPPLRERREDIGLLVAHLLRRFGGDEAAKVRLHVEVMRRLLAHTWPFNVRELERTMEALLLLADGGRAIDARHLALALAAPRALDPAPSTPPPAGKPVRESDEALRARLESLIAEHGGNISAIARGMGRSRVQIHRWLGRLGMTDAVRGRQDGG